MRLLFCGLLALTLAACASDPSIKLTAGKALLVAEASVDGANHTATAIAPSLTPERAQKVKDALKIANTAVGTAHTAYLAGDVSGAVGALDAVFDSVATVQTEAK